MQKIKPSGGSDIEQLFRVIMACMYITCNIDRLSKYLRDKDYEMLMKHIKTFLLKNFLKHKIK